MPSLSRVCLMRYERPRGHYLAGIRNARIQRDDAEDRLVLNVNEAINAGISYEEVAAVLEISRTTVWRRYRWTQQKLDV